MDDDTKIYIEEMSDLLNRAPHTIRQWIGRGELPAKLKPQREGGRQKIYWVEDQVDGLREFAKQKSARRGWQPAHS